MATSQVITSFIDSFIKIAFDLIESLTLLGRVKQRLQLDKVWYNCDLKTPDNSAPRLKKYHSTVRGYDLTFELPIGLCPSDFTSKKEKLLYAFKRAEDIEITTKNRLLIIKVKTKDGKPLM